MATIHVIMKQERKCCSQVWYGVCMGLVSNCREHQLRTWGEVADIQEFFCTNTTEKPPKQISPSICSILSPIRRSSSAQWAVSIHRCQYTHSPTHTHTHPHSLSQYVHVHWSPRPYVSTEGAGVCAPPLLPHQDQFPSTVCESVRSMLHGARHPGCSLPLATLWP